MLRKALLIACMVCAGVMLSLCWPPPLWTSAEQTPATELDRLLQYFVYIRSLPAAALQRERDQQEQELAQRKSAESRLKVALLLSLPGASPRDHERALELLRDYVRAEPIVPARANRLAQVLLTLLTERTAPSLAPLPKNRRLPRCEEQLLIERGNVQKLQKQIDELKNLEKTLLERDGTTNKGT